MVDDLKEMDAAALEQIILEARAVLEERKQAERQKAIDSAQATLAAAGLTFHDAVRHARQTRTTSARKRSRVKPNGGAPKQYSNPENPTQTWTAGRGRPPKWVTALRDREQPS